MKQLIKKFDQLKQIKHPNIIRFYDHWIGTKASSRPTGGGGGGGGDGVERRSVGTRHTPHLGSFASAPPPPDGWAWPTEGERIEVEVQPSDEAPPVWVPSKVLLPPEIQP